MAFSDPVADLLTRGRNAQRAKHKYVDVNCSNLNKSIIEVLKRKGFVAQFLVNEKKHKIRIFLRYLKKERKSLIHNLKRMSKPGRRFYVGYREIPRVFSGLGIAILSTPSGVMSGDEARKARVGGELLCLVW